MGVYCVKWHAIWGLLISYPCDLFDAMNQALPRLYKGCKIVEAKVKGNSWSTSASASAVCKILVKAELKYNSLYIRQIWEDEGKVS